MKWKRLSQRGEGRFSGNLELQRFRIGHARFCRAIYILVGAYWVERTYYFGSYTPRRYVGPHNRQL